MTDFNSDLIEEDGVGSGEAQLVLDLDGFEGPIDLLLSLARDQKVDLAKFLFWHLRINI